MNSTMGYFISLTPESVSYNEKYVETLKEKLGSDEWFDRISRENSVHIRATEDGPQVWVHPRCLVINKYL
jgi:hypothetical protein